MQNDHTFFQNRECRYFPCHKTEDEDSFNCLFCYCPLYALGDKCGGNFTYNEKGYKNCKDCCKPHVKGGYEDVKENYSRIAALAARSGDSQDSHQAAEAGPQQTQKTETLPQSVIIFAFSKKGAQQAFKIRECFEGDAAVLMPQRTAVEQAGSCEDIAGAVEANFLKGRTLIFVGAAGIAVRYIAPFVKDKTTDPAVLVADDEGRRVIPILSGHLGGANETAQKVAAYLHAEAVITTASDLAGIEAVDSFAKRMGYFIPDMKKAARVTALRLEGGEASVKLSPFMNEEIAEDECLLVPRCIILGLGCKKDTDSDKLLAFAGRILEENGIFPQAVKAVVSIDLKKDEPAIRTLAEHYCVPFITYDAKTLENAVGEFSSSGFVKEVTGVDNVCERAVRCFSPACSFAVKKTAEDGMTLALGLETSVLRDPSVEFVKNLSYN